MIRRRHRNHRRETADLNVTAFMNLMVVLVPFLLITAVFSRMAVLELNLPGENSEPPQQEASLQLEIIVRDGRIEVGDRDSGRAAVFASKDGEYDLEALGDYLQQVKARYPDKLDATLLLEPDISYDSLVQVMDTVRVVQLVQNERFVQAELFPDISIGDAPPGTR
ncbi:MAG: biopolymer transporter ExbD [Proteobacteria bacterium]|nr:biopolymer transporter ExbD [Pseudomonadota bacterium]